MSSEQPDAPPVRADGLQLEEDRGLQERIWTAERVAHLVLILLVLAGVSGLSGSGGPFARGTITISTGLAEYPRILRWDTVEELTFRFTEAASTHRLRVTGPIPHRLYIEAMQPEPAAARAARNAIAYDFAAEEAPAATVTLKVRASAPGLLRIGFALDDAPAVEATILVLP